MYHVWENIVMHGSSWLTVVWFYDCDYNCETHYVNYRLERHVLAFLPAYSLKLTKQTGTQIHYGV